MVNDSEKIRKIIKIVFIIIVLIILRFTFKEEIIDFVDEIKLKFGKIATETDIAYEKVQQIEDTNEITYVIIESSVNIRENAGVDFKPIATAQKDDTFVGTGNEKEANNGRIWYEIYIDEGMSLTGWVSSKVAIPSE